MQLPSLQERITEIEVVLSLTTTLSGVTFVEIDEGNNKQVRRFDGELSDSHPFFLRNPLELRIVLCVLGRDVTTCRDPGENLLIYIALDFLPGPHIHHCFV
jgi:hypothetical protein